VTIVLLVEGATETALKQHLKRFLDTHATAEGRPKITLLTKDMMVSSTVTFTKHNVESIISH
jgi:hypothetical protein